MVPTASVCGPRASPRSWLRRNAAAPSHHTAVGAFDVATGRPLRAVEFAAFGRTVTPLTADLLPFAPDGRSFWTVTAPHQMAPGPVWFERWSVDPPGPPWWLLGLTACAAGLAVADRVARPERAC